MDVRELAHVVAGYLPSRNSARLLHVKTISGPASLVHRLEFAIGDDRKAVYVKLPRDSGSNHAMYVARIREEAQLTREIWTTFPGTLETRTVEPIAYIEELQALVTAEAPGRSLLDVIGAGTRLMLSRNTSRLGHLCYLAGRWLRGFHSIGYRIDRVGFRTSLKSYCNTRIDELVNHHASGVSADLANMLRANICDWLEQGFAATGASPVLCHNDYSPHNIIVSDSLLHVIDFSFAGAGFPIFDVACFWHKLEDLKVSPFHSDRQVSDLQRTFVAAYERDATWSSAQARLGLIRLVLSKMCTLVGNPSRRPDTWINANLRRRQYLEGLRSGFDPLPF